MTKEMEPCGPWVLVLVIGAFVEMPSEVGALAGVTASALAENHTQFFSISALEAKGMYKQRTRTAWGHAARRGWARVLYDRRRDLIVHGPRATRNAGGEFDVEEQQRPPIEAPVSLRIEEQGRVSVGGRSAAHPHSPFSSPCRTHSRCATRGRALKLPCRC